jgi:hypothetical protein
MSWKAQLELNLRPIPEFGSAVIDAILGYTELGISYLDTGYVVVGDMQTTCGNTCGRWPLDRHAVAGRPVTAGPVTAGS